MITSWNINSIKSRLMHLLDFLRDSSPEVLLLQETKTPNENFPYLEIEDLGYNIAAHGQKSYNGVAIISKTPIEDVCFGLSEFEDDQARYIEAITYAYGLPIKVASVYVPNGRNINSDRYEYKMRFLAALRRHMAKLRDYDEYQVVAGDYNIAPSDIDCYAAGEFTTSILSTPRERQAFWSIEHLGFIDLYRMINGNKQEYTWWDYRARGYERNCGLRIDHMLASPKLADRVTRFEIHYDIREKEKSSDHVPISCSF